MQVIDAAHARTRVRGNHPEVIMEIATLERIQTGLEDAADWLPAHASHIRDAANDIRTAIEALRNADDSLGRVITNERVRLEAMRP